MDNLSGNECSHWHSSLLFWFFGHQEVCNLTIPALSIVKSVMSTPIIAQRLLLVLDSASAIISKCLIPYEFAALKNTMWVCMCMYSLGFLHKRQGQLRISKNSEYSLRSPRSGSGTSNYLPFNRLRRNLL